MKSGKYGFKLFKQNIGLNVIVIIQLIVVMCIFSNMFSLIQLLKYCDTKMETFENVNFEYYMPHTYASLGFELENDIESTNYDNLIKLNCVVDLLETDFIYNNEEYGRIYSYSKDLFDFLPLELSRGHEFTNEKHDYLEAIAVCNAKGFEVGDETTIYLPEQTDSLYIENNLEVRIKIIGVLKQPAMLFDMSSSGDIGFANMFKDKRSAVTGGVGLILNRSDLDTMNLYTLGSDNRLLVFDNSITETEKYANRTLLSNTGKVINYEELQNNHNQDINITIKNYLPLFCMLTVISLVGMLGVSIINTTRYLKSLHIFFLCGARWKDCIKIIISNIVITVLFAGIPTTLLFLLSIRYNLPLYGSIYMSNSTCAICWLVLTFYAIISFIAPIAILKRNKQCKKY